jgi:hypothetical protein
VTCKQVLAGLHEVDMLSLRIVPDPESCRLLFRSSATGLANDMEICGAPLKEL